MRKIHRVSLFLSLLLGVGALAATMQAKSAVQADADSTTNYPRNGNSGSVMYVNGASTYFNTGEADLAIYCYSSSASAWSDLVSYRAFGDMLRVMLPYNNGAATTWSHYIVCRYNPNLEPSVNQFDGVYNQTDAIPFSSMMYAHNVVNITGYSGNKLNYMFSTSDYFGVRAENHMYLDLSAFPSWEEGDAKFAIYFAFPNSTNENRWSQAHSPDGYYPSFCWKVNGQDNDHLYECVVPNIYSSGFNLWNMVIAVRLEPAATSPNWDQKWNQTQNLSFNSSNHQANMIRITGWNQGQLDNENIISEQSRLDFYGRYFMDTVTCSGTGASDATTSDMWNAVKTDYQRMSRMYQGDIWTCVADEEGSDIAQAMARYDYIVLYKAYGHEDFINRAESPEKTYVLIDRVNVSTEKSARDAIVIGSVVAATVMVSGLLILRGKKKNKENAE